MTIRRKRCILNIEIKRGGDKNGQGRHQVADRLGDEHNLSDLVIRQEATQSKRAQETQTPQT